MNNKKLFSRGIGTIFMNGLFYRNPVLIGALGLYPVVAAATGLQNAEELSLLFLLLALPVNLLLCLLGMLVPKWARPGLVLLATGALYIPAAWLMERVFPEYVADLGMAAGLMVCNSMIVSRADEYAPEHIVPAVLADTLGCALGFATVACVMGGVRGLWNSHVSSRGGNLPFAGFILLAFLAAAAQWVNGKRALRSARKKGGLS